MGGIRAVTAATASPLVPWAGRNQSRSQIEAHVLEGGNFFRRPREMPYLIKLRNGCQNVVPLSTYDAKMLILKTYCWTFFNAAETSLPSQCFCCGILSLISLADDLFRAPHALSEKRPVRSEGAVFFRTAQHPKSPHLCNTKTPSLPPLPRLPLLFFVQNPCLFFSQWILRACLAATHTPSRTYVSALVRTHNCVEIVATTES